MHDIHSTLLSAICRKERGGIGRGIRREGKEDVYEVRTFLTDKQLSRKQLKDTEDVRELGDEQNAAKSLKYFKKRMTDGGEEFFFIKEFVNLAKEIAIQDGIRKFDKRKFASMFLSKLFHWSEEKTQEAVKMLFP